MTETTGQIKTTTIDQLPEERNINSLWMFGYNPTKPAGQRSVKVPFSVIAPQFGVSQSIGNSTTTAPSEQVVANALKQKADSTKSDGSTVLYTDKNGKLPESVLALASEAQNGLMSKEQVKQLNEIIESMKTDEEKYNMHVQMICTNEKAGVVLDNVYYRMFATNTLPIKCKSTKGAVFAYPNKTLENFITAPIIATAPNDIIDLYSDALHSVSAYAPNTTVVGMTMSSKKHIEKIAWAQMHAVEDLNLHGLSSVGEIALGGWRKVKRVNLSNGIINSVVSLRDFPLLTDLYIGRNVSAYISTIHTLIATHCPLLKTIAIAKMNPLQLVEIYKSGFDRAGLLELEKQWISRSGLNTGVLRLDLALYNSLTSDDRKKFTDKNITFDIIA